MRARQVGVPFSLGRVEKLDDLDIPAGIEQGHGGGRDVPAQDDSVFHDAMLAPLAPSR
jgi:hypothetical protein